MIDKEGLTMRWRYCMILVSAIFIVSVLNSPARAANPAKITTTNPFLNLPRPADDPRWAEAFAHWDLRDDDDEVMAAVKIFDSLAADQPDRVEVQLWIARSYYLAGLRKKGKEQADWMEKSIGATDKVLAKNPDNEMAQYWRICAIIYHRDFKADELPKIRTLGKKYDHLREFPVPDNDPLWKEAMTNWDRRSQRDKALAAIEIFGKLEKKYPTRIEPKFWLCRSNYWMHYMEAEKVDKARWCLIASEWGHKAIMLEPRNPGANYFTAASVGQYASNTSFLNMIRYSLEIIRELTIVMEENPNYFYSGPSQFLALAIARAGSLVAKALGLVGFPQDLVESATTFASVYEPRYLRNNYALGEMYITLGRMDEAKKALEKVVNADPAALKLQEPENRVAQKLAQDLLDKHF